MGIGASLRQEPHSFHLLLVAFPGAHWKGWHEPQTLPTSLPPIINHVDVDAGVVVNSEVLPGDVLIEQVQGLIPTLARHLLTDQHVEQVVGDLLQVLLGV